MFKIAWSNEEHTDRKVSKHWHGCTHDVKMKLKMQKCIFVLRGVGEKLLLTHKHKNVQDIAML